ncbi:Uncharacterized protein OBRU01_03637 [Operophtera brumata]|uniref:Uncharacterized protein n=1 Tax=Operophtera brumata TaxID=104452 RepID=A0A0L7LQG8_OPEBR|nr:Uncharacterized protein OBRU01_03637 [Operophtera brumata]
MRKTLLIYDDHGPVVRGERMACSMFLWREISSSLARPQLCTTHTTLSTSAKCIYRLLSKSREGRWACSSIERGYSPSEAREIRGIASFHHPGGFAWGYVRMTQLIHNDGSASDTVIERSGERFACANIEPDKDIIKFVNIMKPPRFVLGQFLSEVRRVLGVPEWMLSVDARRTRALHHAACVQVTGVRETRLTQYLHSRLRQLQAESHHLVPAVWRHRPQ